MMVEEDKRSAIEAGCADYATKPLNLKSVTEKIILHLESNSNVLTT